MCGRDSSGSRRRHFVELLGFGDVGERETLGCKSNFRPPRIFERAQIGAHAEIVGYSVARAERQIAAARSRRNIRDAGTTLRGDARQLLAKERPSARSRVQAEHAYLL